MNAKGLLTGSKVYLLDGSGNYTVSAMYYDYKGQLVQSRSTNHLGGYDITYNAYSFSGQPLKTYKTHGISGASDTYKELYTYTYDPAQRPLVTTYSINGGTSVILTDNTGGYDEIGRLVSKKRHNGTDIESFDYNIRNWTTRITSGTYQEQLFYNTLPSGATSTPCYNGNIAYMITGSLTSMPMYSYTYTYDNLNRLTAGNGYYYTSAQSGSSAINSESFSYDKLGNIAALTRTNGTTTVDNLRYTYNGNQVTSIFDFSGSRNSYSIKEYQNKSSVLTAKNEMGYDPNGNMTKDLDRKIVTIRYNILNLPDTIQFSTGNQIINRYDASGCKLGTEYLTRVTDLATPLNSGEVMTQSYTINTINQNGTVYIDNKEYNTLNGSPIPTSLQRIYNAEGYSENLISGTTPNYFYYRKDHLGNNREVWLANTNTTVQRNQYYASGLPWSSSSINQGTQIKKYNGKEFIEMHGLDTYDYGARGMYPAIMRFTRLDDFSEEYYSTSPYSYVRNNPILRIDIDGNWDVTVHAYSDRAKHGYGNLVVTNNAGNVVYSTTVRLEGSNRIENGYNKRDRTRTYADTPTGTYKILGWESRSDRTKYGPNPILVLDYIDGEASDKRDAIRVHGGRQEIFNKSTGEWENIENPVLQCTYGCLRIKDKDILKMKEVTDNLQKNDPTEKGNFLYVTNDLDSKQSGAHFDDNPVNQIRNQIMTQAWKAAIQLIFSIASQYNIPVYYK